MTKTITIEVSAADWRALEHDLLDPEQWLKEAVVAKVASCSKRMAAEAVRVLTNDPTVVDMPAKPERLIAELVKRPDYKNRAARDAEEATQRAKG